MCSKLRVSPLAELRGPQAAEGSCLACGWSVPESQKGPRMRSGLGDGSSSRAPGEPFVSGFRSLMALLTSSRGSKQVVSEALHVVQKLAYRKTCGNSA